LRFTRRSPDDSLRGGGGINPTASTNTILAQYWWKGNDVMGEVARLVLRTILLYFTVLTVIRVMGKREIGELSPFDLVIAIMIAELAVFPLASIDTPLAQGLVPMAVLLILQVGLAFLCLKSPQVRKLLSGVPSIMIRNGRIVESELRRQRYAVDELLLQLREKGYTNPQDVEFAILEASGNLSVVPKASKRPVTPEDLGLSVEYDGLSYPLIIDGQVIDENLAEIKLDRSWLMEQLAGRGINSPKDVFFALIDTRGELFVQPYDDAPLEDRPPTI